MSLITLSRDAQLRSLDLGKDNVVVGGREAGKQEMGVEMGIRPSYFKVNLRKEGID